jgi:hypothetical protein
MTVPKNILRFEVLLYISILLDLLSAAFLGRDHLVGLGAATETRVLLIAVAIVMAECFFVHLAARKRKNWARWTLLAVQVLSCLSSLNPAAVGPTTAEMTISVISTALTAIGLYFSFTGDAKGWFA